MKIFPIKNNRQKFVYMLYLTQRRFEMQKNKQKSEKKTRKSLYELMFKRLFDVIFALIFIVVLSPVLLIVWLVLRITLRGKAIFSQYRPGKDGKIFKFYKFRSMTNKTDENGQLLPDKDRVTKFGKFIRKTSLDELPQLFNILKGDMSFIGPRPRLVKDMIFYDEEVLKAYSVRPGLTGLAQVDGGRSSASWEEIFEKDLKYAQKITFWGDVKILFKTVGAVFKSDANTSGESARDYYYSDYLLRTGKITPEQYSLGLNRAVEIINTKDKIVYQSDLHNENGIDKTA